MDRLEFRHVRAFLSVARHLHFARAADELDMAPPALTRQIQEAERLLGVRLFHRSRRAVTLSAAGEAYLVEASAAFEHLQRGRELAALAERGELGRIEVGYVSSAVYSGALQRTVGAFRAAHPRIELNLREVPMDDVAKQIDAGRLDIAYVRPPLPLPGELRTVTLQRDVFIAAVPADSPLAARETVKAAKLAGARFAVPEQELGTLEVARRGRFAPVVAARPGGLLAVLACVSVNGCVAVIPDVLAQCVSLPGVAYRPLAGKPITSELALACRRFEKAPAVRAFLRAVSRVE
ncbi:LysR family transcriptional regulator [Burkholderia stagnalis]|uniref:LysR family transcriptional regulator n=1 Tax=Burkholderia stagnalis TaxID=1503054 RepID=UPI000759562F|nr:LysR family transcriptional regulator [Burkholderia stagnalis]AOK55941.1 LysR family transcriptional regulator [Burkholderia stagnalis]KVN84309.1 LysR family transcriptional regulator [Burkholderia stagnalis]KWO30129.1 LysR family transcriptional regulator [Burkholderia stagnalis]KWO33438.1 LysR family transcriptional regulator [Burkholderia stagnalis]